MREKESWKRLREEIKIGDLRKRCDGYCGVKLEDTEF
jgi:hypothetical protein